MSPRPQVQPGKWFNIALCPANLGSTTVATRMMNQTIPRLMHEGAYASSHRYKLDVDATKYFGAAGNTLESSKEEEELVIFVYDSACQQVAMLTDLDLFGEQGASQRGDKLSFPRRLIKQDASLTGEDWNAFILAQASNLTY